MNCVQNLLCLCKWTDSAHTCPLWEDSFCCVTCQSRAAKLWGGQKEGSTLIAISWNQRGSDLRFTLRGRTFKKQNESMRQMTQVLLVHYSRYCTHEDTLLMERNEKVNFATLECWHLAFYLFVLLFIYFFNWSGPDHKMRFSNGNRNLT